MVMASAPRRRGAARIGPFEITHFDRYLFPLMWLGWAACWGVLSSSVKAAVKTGPLARRLGHIVPLMLAALLLWKPKLPLSLLGDRFVPWAIWPFWVGAVMTAGGLLFAVWARVHIGANWSGIVTIKKGHELVTTGPYAVVRHPI